jgi:branched-chain amino acid aminotransferase
VLLNERGEVAECTAANIFCVREGKVLTPPLSSGCLAGITRAVMLDIGAAAGIVVEERLLMPDDLYQADEVFISSTNRNIIAVTEIAGRKLESTSRPVMAKLELAFSSYTNDYVQSRLSSTVKP